jgi:hypothetical protein
MTDKTATPAAAKPRASLATPTTDTVIDRNVLVPAGAETIERAEADPAAVAEAAPAAPAAATAEAAPAEPAAAAAPAGNQDPVARAAENASKANSTAVAALDKVQRALSADVTVLPEAGVEIRRGMSDVARLGYLLSELSYIVLDAGWEAQFEGDGSKVPAKLRNGLAALAEAYRDMSAEEVAELLAGVDAVVVVESGLIAFAAAAGDIQRADGEKIELPAELTARMAEMQTSFIDRGWLPKLDATTDAEAITRVTGERDKALAENDVLLRTLTETTENTTKLATRVEGLSSEIERVKARVAPPRTAASATVAVSKEEDVAGVARAEGLQLSEEDVQRALDAMPKEERDLAIMRAALSKPILIKR